MLGQICEICRFCSDFDNTLTYRAAFLLEFYGFLRISNVAPAFQKSFSPDKHLLRQDDIYQSPSLHLRLKWAKKAPEKVHTIKLPHVHDPTQCVAALLQDIPLPPSAPLLILDDGTLLTQFLLKITVGYYCTPYGSSPFGFHTFRRSVAYDPNVLLQNMVAYGAWQSGMVWTYISGNTTQALQVSLVFQQLANSLP